MTDFLPIHGLDHLEFHVGNAKQASQYYSRCLGFRVRAYRGLETGSRDRASYLLEQGNIRLVLTSALGADHPIARSVLKHGDNVAVIALEVPDARLAHEETTRRGAESASEPAELVDENGRVSTAAIHIYGDTIIRFVERGDYHGSFAPGFQPLESPGTMDAGLRSIDHVVGNVELGAMDRWVEFFRDVLGFSQLIHFDDRAISTEYSALMSKVMQDGSGKIKFPINEPASGRRRSQIQEYLDYNGGPGVQHVAFSSPNILETVAGLRDNGVEFLHVPDNYYDDLEYRVGRIDEPVDVLRELGILVDRDDDGYLLQIFSKPVEDRPTVFFEIIERHGALGFGAGNFKSLFEALEREQAVRGNL